MSIVAIALAAGLAGAVQEPAPPHVETRSEIRIVTRGGPDGPSRMDADGDGVVTREEFMAPVNGAFDRLDTDRDGCLSAAELTAGGGDGPVRVFMHGGPAGPGATLFGPDGPGGNAEVFMFRRGGPDGAPPPGPGRQVFVRRFGSDGPGELDKDGDGEVSEAEFLAPLREAFQRMDRDGDGFMDADEGPAAPPASAD